MVNFEARNGIWPANMLISWEFSNSHGDLMGFKGIYLAKVVRPVLINRDSPTKTQLIFFMGFCHQERDWHSNFMSFRYLRWFMMLMTYITRIGGYIELACGIKKTQLISWGWFIPWFITLKGYDGWFLPIRIPLWSQPYLKVPKSSQLVRGLSNMTWHRFIVDISLQRLKLHKLINNHT